MQDNTIRNKAIKCKTIQYKPIQYNAYNTIQCIQYNIMHTIQYNAYNTIQCIQYNALQCNAMQSSHTHYLGTLEYAKHGEYAGYAEYAIIVYPFQ